MVALVFDSNRYMLPIFGQNKQQHFGQRGYARLAPLQWFGRRSSRLSPRIPQMNRLTLARNSRQSVENSGLDAQHAKATEAPNG